MKVVVELELGMDWDDYVDVCDELLLEDLDLIHKRDILSAKIISRDDKVYSD